MADEPDDWELKDGIPHALWAAKRLGDNGTYALCADLRVPGNVTFWVCERLPDAASHNDPKGGKEGPGSSTPARWRAMRELDAVACNLDGTVPMPKFWSVAGEARMTLLTFPCDGWVGYSVEGMPDV